MSIEDRPTLVIAATRLELEPLLAGLERRETVPLRYGEAMAGEACGTRLVAAWLGLGKANTAAGLALAVDSLAPARVIQVGIGGAYPGSGLTVGSAAVASLEIHLDSGARGADGFEDMADLGFPLLRHPVTVYNAVPVDEDLGRALAAGRAPHVPFGTAETVTGTPYEAAALRDRFGVAVESMEGAAAAQVCLALGVPFGEVRGLSNEVGRRDRSQWRIEPAVAAAHGLLRAWLARRGA